MVIWFWRSLHKTCHNTGFLWPLFSRTRIGSMILIFAFLHSGILAYFSQWSWTYPVEYYMFKVNNKNTRSGVLIVNFEHISHLVLMFLLLTLLGKFQLGRSNVRIFNLWFCPYTENYGSEKTRILTYLR